MKLVNYTPYPAYLFRGCLEARRIVASVLVRATYTIVDGRLTPADEQTWHVSPAPWSGPQGQMPGDQRFVREGVDVLLFGSARSPGGRPAPKIDVVARVGTDWRSRLIAWGERVWRDGPNGLVPGAPEPVRAVPLTLDRAFGGKDVWDGLEVPFVDNPSGRGFYLEASRARGGRLPELEDPDAPVRAWNSRPEPVGAGVCPQHFGPRVRRGVEVDARTGAVQRLRPSFFNDAFPRMIVPRVAPGDRVEVSGMREDGPLRFVLPDSGLRVRIEVGDDVGERAPAIDQIGIEADLDRVFLTYRYTFQYALNPRERRSCMLGLVRPD